jgi:hypothetical protein
MSKHSLVYPCVKFNRWLATVRFDFLQSFSFDTWLSKSRPNLDWSNFFIFYNCPSLFFFLFVCLFFQSTWSWPVCPVDREGLKLPKSSVWHPLIVRLYSWSKAQNQKYEQAKQTVRLFRRVWQFQCYLEF